MDAKIRSESLGPSQLPSSIYEISTVPEVLKSSSKAIPRSPCSIWQRLTNEVKSATSASSSPFHDLTNPLR